MAEDNKKVLNLPAADIIRKAVEIYMKHAWMTPPPETTADILPPQDDFDPEDWISHPMVERDYYSDDDKTLVNIRSLIFRLGNMFYPHMKLRLTKIPKADFFIFSVDSHDAILQAPEGTPDYKMLEELKQANSQINDAITSEWDEEDIPTERNYLRMKIKQAKDKKQGNEG